MELCLITELPKEHFGFWNDGLRAAIGVLQHSFGWNIYVYNIPSMVKPSIPDHYDFYLFWGAFGRPQHERRLFKKQGLLFGGGNTYHPNMHNFDIVFAESKIDYQEIRSYGIKTLQAFGTNTDLFKPDTNQPKTIDYLYPSAFAQWKRHDKFAAYVKQQTPAPVAMAIGYMQPDGWEKECYEVCQKNGISVMPWVPSETLAWFYNASKNVYVAADQMGGCQRTILEAKACNVNVIVDSDSTKLAELGKLTHEDVVKDWNQMSYAEKIKQGIEEVVYG